MTEPTPTTTAATVTLYWRPGCGFCASLRAAVAHHDIAVDERNIWNDPDDARVVQRFANGNETVPTVVIGDPDSDEAVGLVNPTIADLVAVLARVAPEVLPAELRDHAG